MLWAGIGFLLFAAFIWFTAPMHSDMNRSLFGNAAVRSGSAGRSRGERGPSQPDASLRV